MTVWRWPRRPPVGEGDGRRWRFVYGYRTWHTGPAPDGLDGVRRPVCGYVGQTVQELEARDRQHRGLAPNRDGAKVCQPWSDVIDGDIYLIEKGWWTQAQLDRRELRHIRRLQPLYNIVGNLDNPYQIPQWTARQQRDARNAARGLPPIEWGDGPAAQEPDRERVLVAAPTRRVAAQALPLEPSPLPVDVPPPAVPDPPWWCWPPVWVAIACAVWWAAGPLQLDVPWRAGWSLLIATLPVVTVWWLAVGSRRRIDAR